MAEPDHIETAFAAMAPKPKPIRQKKKQRTATEPVEYGSILRDDTSPIAAKDSVLDTMGIGGVRRYEGKLDVVMLQMILSAMQKFNIEDVNMLLGVDTNRIGLKEGEELTDESRDRCCKTNNPKHLTFMGNPPSNIVNFMATITVEDPIVPRVVVEDSDGDSSLPDSCALDVKALTAACKVAKNNMLDPASSCSFVLFDDKTPNATVLCNDDSSLNRAFKTVAQLDSTLEMDPERLNFFKMPKDLVLCMDLTPIQSILKTNDTGANTPCEFTVHTIDKKYLADNRQLLRVTVTADELVSYIWLATQKTKGPDGTVVWEAAPPPDPKALSCIPKTALVFLTRHAMFFKSFETLFYISNKLMYGGSAANTSFVFDLVNEDSTDSSMCLARINVAKTNIRVLFGSVIVGGGDDSIE